MYRIDIYNLQSEQWESGGVDPWVYTLDNALSVVAEIKKNWIKDGDYPKWLRIVETDTLDVNQWDHPLWQDDLPTKEQRLRILYPEWHNV